MKWMLRLDRTTPGYLIREELKRDKMVSRHRRRTMRFERKLIESQGEQLARKCSMEMARKGGNGT